MLPLCLQACSERVKEVGGVCVCVGIYVCDSDCSQLFATWIGFIFSGWTYLDSNHCHCDTRLLMPVVVTESACVLQSSHSVTLPFVRISGDVLDPFSFVSHLSLARSSAPSSSILSVCNNPPLSLSFCLSVQITRVVPQNCLKQTLLLYFMAKRLLDLRHKGTETCTDCSVQPVTFGVQSQPSSLKLQRLCTHTRVCVQNNTSFQLPYFQIKLISCLVCCP